MRKLNLLLVDNNPHFLKAAREVLAVLPGVAGIECVTSGEGALALASRSRPDLVLTDLVMPGMSGFQVIRSLRAREFPPRVVALSLHEGAEYRAAVMRSGASGFVSKREFGALIPALIASLAGNSDGDAWGDRRGLSTPPRAEISSFGPRDADGPHD